MIWFRCTYNSLRFPQCEDSDECYWCWDQWEVPCPPWYWKLWGQVESYFLSLYTHKEGDYAVFNKDDLDSGLNFLALYRYLNHPYTGRCGKTSLYREIIKLIQKKIYSVLEIILKFIISFWGRITFVFVSFIVFETSCN